MKNRLGALAVVALLAGCSGQDSETKSGNGQITRGSLPAGPQITGVSPDGLAALSQDTARILGSAPDKGRLFTYESKSAAKRRGAYTQHQVRLSEEHAIRGVATGMMTVPAPDGSEIKIRYQSHEEHPDGNWSWIGRVVGGDAAQEAIFTFGEEAVFGSIPQAAGPALRLTTENGIAYLVQADPAKLKRGHRAGGDTMMRARTPADSDSAMVAMALAKARTLEKADVSTKAFTSGNTIDLVVGYSNGFVTTLGSAGAAVTRLNNLVTFANQALSNSNINARIRVVRAVQVAYADNTDNGDALEQLTGHDGSSPFTPPASLLPLRTARDEYGADLVTLVRDFRPENNGCGIAWLNGANGTNITVAADAPFGYSVVSDGNYDEGGNTYFCENTTLVHEMAHNMGSAHDLANANGVPGRYPYSYGYKTSVALGNFFTVMAYGDDNQQLYSVFSSPDITSCGGRACGVANQADNARSLRQTIPTVTQFRATKVPLEVAISNLYAVNKIGANVTDLHVLSASSTFKSYSKNVATGFPQAGSNNAINFLFGDYNGDNVVDMYRIAKVSATGKTSVQVRSGVGNFKTILFNGTTPLVNTGSDARWVFKLGDSNLDGKLDLYAINKMGATKTEVHLLNGASNFQTFLLQTSTALGKVGTNNAWKFEVGDYNNDGVLDLYAISKMGATKTEVHVLNGSGGFKTYLLQKSTILGKTGTDNLWEFKVADYNRDGKLDLYAIKKSGGTKTEVHVLNGANGFQSYLVNVATILGLTGSDSRWEFALVN